MLIHQTKLRMLSRRNDSLISTARYINIIDNNKYYYYTYKQKCLILLYEFQCKLVSSETDICPTFMEGRSFVHALLTAHHSTLYELAESSTNSHTHLCNIFSYLGLQLSSASFSRVFHHRIFIQQKLT
jgi:hypothetical protein